jgi:hypothetical protein
VWRESVDAMLCEESLKTHASARTDILLMERALSLCTRPRMTHVGVTSGRKRIGVGWRSIVSKSKMVSFADSERLSMQRKLQGSDVNQTVAQGGLRPSCRPSRSSHSRYLWSGVMPFRACE